MDGCSEIGMIIVLKFVFVQLLNGYNTFRPSVQVHADNCRQPGDGCRADKLLRARPVIWWHPHHWTYSDQVIAGRTLTHVRLLLTHAACKTALAHAYRDTAMSDPDQLHDQGLLR